MDCAREGGTMDIATRSRKLATASRLRSLFGACFEKMSMLGLSFRPNGSVKLTLICWSAGVSSRICRARSSSQLAMAIASQPIGSSTEMLGRKNAGCHVGMESLSSHRTFFVFKRSFGDYIGLVDRNTITLHPTAIESSVANEPLHCGVRDFIDAPNVAGGLGFEPRLTESESAVLPLNYPPTRLDCEITRCLAAGRPGRHRGCCRMRVVAGDI